MQPTNMRGRVMSALFLLSMITYLDRVCISVAAPEMSKDLGMSPSQLGWVFGIFTIAYGAFEIPGGWMGDRFGPRKILTRIVIWWSVFTALTGTVSSYVWLLVVRASFGAGEAGAYPNSSCTISRWFPVQERARSHGFIWMASRLGGALAPPVVIWLQTLYGWRTVFYLLAVPGIVWAVVWFVWFRDNPRDMPAVNEGELAIIGQMPKSRHGAPFLAMLKSGNLWAVMAMYHVFCYGSYWYIAWAPTYLVQEKGFQGEMLAAYSSLPFLLGAIANGVGGYASDGLVRRFGLKIGRRAIGVVSLSLAGLFMLVSLGVQHQALAVILLMMGFAAADACLPNCWAVCLDIGKENAGTVTGAMNTAGQIGASVMSVAFGYLVETYGYNVPLAGLGVLFILSALLWLRIDPTKPIFEPSEAAT